MVRDQVAEITHLRRYPPYVRSRLQCTRDSGKSPECARPQLRPAGIPLFVRPMAQPNPEAESKLTDQMSRCVATPGAKSADRLGNVALFGGLQYARDGVEPARHISRAERPISGRFDACRVDRISERDFHEMERGQDRGAEGQVPDISGDRIARVVVAGQAIGAQPLMGKAAAKCRVGYGRHGLHRSNSFCLKSLPNFTKPAILQAQFLGPSYTVARRHDPEVRDPRRHPVVPGICVS